MKKIIKLFLFAALLCNGLKVSAQIDTVFWFAAPWVTPDHNGNIPMAFRISTFGNPTVVRIQQPASTYDTTINVAANSLFSKDLSHLLDSLESKPANQLLRTGFKISSDFPITVVYDFISLNPSNPETYSLKGQNGLGTEFVTPFQTLWNNRNIAGIDPYSIFCVVASEDSTTVYITPRCDIIGHPANVTFSVFLPKKGNVYTVQNVTQITNVVGSNLSGSIVVADKPVSVTVSDDSVNPSGGGGCYDLMGDQIVPTDVIGNEYIINKGILNAGSNESFFVTATKNFTTVTVNDGVNPIITVLLNQGDTRAFSLTQQLTYCVSDKPVYVIHMSGYGCELGEAILPPLNCSGSNQVSFARNNAQQFSLNILCRAGDENSFILNGSATLIPGSAFAPVPGTGGAWLGAQISYTTAQIAASSSNLVTNSTGLFSLGVINGGASTGCLYHYLSSFIRKVRTQAGPDQNICTNATSIDLNGSVSGGATTGIWTTLNGSGSFNNATSFTPTYTLAGNDTSKASITFVLASTGNCNPVTDTIVVAIAKSPVAEAGNGTTYCENNMGNISLTGAFSYAAGATWTSNTGGSFSNPGSTSTTYLPSPTDLTNNTVTLYYTTSGSSSGCPNTTDSVTINFIDPPVLDAGAISTVCANNPLVTLNGNITGFTNSVLWSTAGSGSFFPNNTINTTYQPSNTDINLGSVMLYLTSQNNGICNAVKDSLQVLITAAPVVNAGVNDTLCITSTSVSLTGNISGIPGTGVWTAPAGGGSFNNTTSLNTIYTFGPSDVANGFVDMYLESTGGNCNPVKDTVRIYLIGVSQVDAGLTQNVCENATVILSGSINGSTTTGVWTSNGSGTYNPGNTNLNTFYTPSVSDLATGSVNFTLTSTGNTGCPPQSDIVTINFIPSPTADFNANNDCVGNVLNFADNSLAGAGSLTNYSWDFDDASGTFTNINEPHTYVAPGVYNVTHIVTSNNGCTDTIVKPITVYQLPQANYYSPVVCQYNTLTLLDTTVSNDGAIVNWDWDFGDGSAHSSLENPTHIYNTAGPTVITLTTTSSFGCVGTITDTLMVNASPVANFSAVNNPAEVLEPIQFTDLTTGTSPIVNWYYDFDDENGSNLPNPTHAYSYQDNFVVVLTVTDNLGCSDTVSKSIDIILEPQLPTGFTPNGDNKNDVLLIRGGPFKTSLLRVYNNWGQLIFESTDQSIGWDGKFNGVEQPIGVYAWVMEVESLNGKVFKKSGDVTLLR